jgi:beta-glucuronidase
VPSAFDASPQYSGRRGSAAYFRRIHIPAGRGARLMFGAVSIRARVFVDGVRLKDHACGYAPFHVDVPPSSSEWRDLIVLVDNRFDFARAPMHEPYFDFYQYGGIIREVALHTLPPSGRFIERVEVTPSPSGYREGEISAAVFLAGAEGMTVRLSTRIDDGDVREHTVKVEQGRTVIPLRVPEPTLWSPEYPNLHRLHVVLGEDEDDMEVSFGLRRIESRAGRIWLNGEPIRLIGYNRHEWDANCGPATPVQKMAHDLDHLRNLGCNFVRGAHYPHDQRFLDLCDEMGLLVWEENLGWQQHERALTDTTYRKHHAQTLRAMIGASFNHPCVIMWGFLNECDSHEPYSDTLFHESATLVRELDPSRLLSYAAIAVRSAKDRHFHLADVISINVYPGWYNCEDVEEPLELVQPMIDKLFETVDGRGFSDKPVLVSEIGAEGLYGYHDLHKDFYSEEYQAALIERAICSSLEHPRCSGIALWQFSDVRSYGGGRALLRPRTFNNKGTVDEFRRPKMAYWKVRELFHKYTGQPLPGADVSATTAKA